MLPLSRAALIALALLVSIAPATAEEPADTLSLSIDEARQLARAALAEGRADITAEIARGLLQRDPADIEALMMLGWAEVGLGNPRAARAAGARAYALARGKQPLRFDAARLAAKGAYDEGRLTLAGYWLRRAGDAATSPQERTEAVEGFRDVRSQNPWNTRLNFSLSPSSNINGGAKDDRLTIDGRPTGAILSPDAQALSGFEATLDLSTSYRLPSGPRSQTAVGVRLFGSTYAMSEEARRQTEERGTKGSDFAFAAVETSVRHLRLPESGKGTISLGFTVGQTWYGGQLLNHYARLDAARSFPAGEAADAAVSGSLEQSLSDRDDDRNFSATLNGQWNHELRSGAVLGFSAGISGTSSNDPSNEFTAVRGGVSYALARPVGPAEVTLGLSIAAKHYPSTFTGSLFGRGERDDLRVSGTVEMLLPKAEVMGFAPTVTLSAGRTWSNASRFETEDFGVAFGLKSTF